MVVDYDLDSETRMQLNEERQRRREMWRRTLDQVMSVTLGAAVLLLAIAVWMLA